jgi:hypothetical protein
MWLVELTESLDLHWALVGRHASLINFRIAEGGRRREVI